jgi:hypothetical protein
MNTEKEQFSTYIELDEHNKNNNYQEIINYFEQFYNKNYEIKQ